ncbi:unnamed protein product [Paramecium sonneborni]|uniref:Tetratricopeptide repeat protein n=1 Tax=Paramecium sonneborni TaxID=65129 RepID=A0A8S1RUQ2_9CILI|nr:unnamed protein product [Paramecium sonneborni]
MNLIAQILKATNLSKEAIMCLDDAIKINPYSFSAYNIKSLTLVKMGCLEEALESIDIGIQNQPESYILFNNKGLILYCLGCFDEAISNLEHAIQLCPEISILQQNKLYLESLQSTPHNQEILESIKSQLKISENQIISSIFISDQYYIDMFHLDDNTLNILFQNLSVQ